jgi:ribosomal-protein-alanine N-acetyltransferase
MLIVSRFPVYFPSIVGECVSLRELNESDIPGWYSRAIDQESAFLSGDPVPTSLEEGHSWLSEHKLRFATRQALRWAITVEQAKGSIGTVGLSLPCAGSDRAELGIVIAREQWGKGYGQASTRLVLDYAFEEMGLRRVEADVLKHNVSCIRVLENCGFSFVKSFIEQLPTDPFPVEVCHYEFRSSQK